MKTFKQFATVKEDPDGTTHTVNVGKGLSRKQAYRAASKKIKPDFRGLTYDEKSGKVTVV